MYEFVCQRVIQLTLSALIQMETHLDDTLGNAAKKLRVLTAVLASDYRNASFAFGPSTASSNTTPSVAGVKVEVKEEPLQSDHGVKRARDVCLECESEYYPDPNITNPLRKGVCDKCIDKKKAKYTAKLKTLREELETTRLALSMVRGDIQITTAKLSNLQDAS